MGLKWDSNGTQMGLKWDSNENQMGLSKVLKNDKNYSLSKAFWLQLLKITHCVLISEWEYCRDCPCNDCKEVRKNGGPKKKGPKGKKPPGGAGGASKPISINCKLFAVSSKIS